MTQNISGPGIGLSVPQALYPDGLAVTNAPYQQGTNEVRLAAGQALPIPAGEWLITLGKYSVIQFLDPVSTTWRIIEASREGPQFVKSDGFTRRIANLTGCPVAAVVTNMGNGSYVESTTTVTPNLGNSTWKAVVGGAITSISVSVAGAGYGMPPVCFVPAPAAPGVQATAVATISGGSVSTITLVDAGAGYESTPTMTILPNPADPNFTAGSITTHATAVLTTGRAGSVTAVLCTNSGVALSALPTLTIAGAGASATAVPVWMSTVTSTSISAAGAAYVSLSALLTTTGGRTAGSDAASNPEISMTAFTPRPLRAEVGMANATASLVTIDDRGLFTGTPTSMILPQGNVSAQTTASIATIVLTQGSLADTILMQQL